MPRHTTRPGCECWGCINVARLDEMDQMGAGAALLAEEEGARSG